MTGVPRDTVPDMRTQVRSTLWKVLTIQGFALLLLWLLQSRYAS